MTRHTADDGVIGALRNVEQVEPFLSRVRVDEDRTMNLAGVDDLIHGYGTDYGPPLVDRSCVGFWRLAA